MTDLRFVRTALDEGSELLLPLRGQPGTLALFRGQPLDEDVVIEVRFHSDSEGDGSGTPYRRALCPRLTSGVLCFRDEAIAPASALLAPFGQLIPASCADAEVVIFNPTLIAEFIDVHASDIAYTTSGKIIMVRHYELRRDIDPPPVFLPAEHPAGPMVLRAEFAAGLEAAGVTAGTLFRPLP